MVIVAVITTMVIGFLQSRDAEEKRWEEVKLKQKYLAERHRLEIEWRRNQWAEMNHGEQIDYWRQIAERSKKNSGAFHPYLQELVEQVTQLQNPKDRIAWWDGLPGRKELLPENMSLGGYIDGFDKWKATGQFPPFSM